VYQAQVTEERSSADARDGEDIRAAAEGDLEAFGRVVERYQHVALRAAWLVVRDEATAQDVCQEAFLRAHRSLARFRADAPFRPWLLTIVTNVARNTVRAESRRGGMWSRLTRTVRLVQSGPERAVERAEGRDALLEAIALLPGEDQDVIHLRYFLELPEAEVGDALGIPTGTAKSRLNRARRHLREVIAAHYPDLVPAALAVEDVDV